jgi:hypothetical protein
MRARLAKQELQDEERIARQMNADNGGSNENSPPSRAIIRCPLTISFSLNVGHAHTVAFVRFR